MKILALDLALETGWAFGENIASAHCGIWALPGYSDDKIERTLGSIYSAVNTICRGNKIEGVVIEAALRTINKKNSRGITTPTSAHGDRCLTMLNGAARAGAANAGVTKFWHPAPSTWRKVVLGNGFPEKPKEEAVKFCARIGRAVENHNTAEALCMLDWKTRESNLLDRVKG